MDVVLGCLLATPAHPIDPARLQPDLGVHESWVASDGKSGRRADFSEHNLSGLDLSGRSLATISFANANLKGTNLRGAVLAACDFTDANLRDADLSGSDLRAAVLPGALLAGAPLGQARTGTLPEPGMSPGFPTGFP